jgi:hypothetical protein
MRAASFACILGRLGSASTTTSTATSPMLARMFEKRLHGYRAIGYTCDSGTPPKRELDDALEAFDIREARDEDQEGA